MAVTAADMREIREALRTTELFEMLTPAELKRVAEAGDVRSLERDELLFAAGEVGDCLYLLLDGAIEIVRPTDESDRPVPVAYITPGELIGDMALLTATPRRSDARVPESARVWRLSRADFERLTQELPAYGIELARVFARRLQDLITHMRRQARRKELSGKLRYFDMPTVVQTLLTTGQTGILAFARDSGRVYAEVMLGKGHVDRARFGPLEGEEAFHEIFLFREEGEFYFRSVVEPDADAVSPAPITSPAMHLMMEAMRRADVVHAHQEELAATTRTYRALAPELAWSDRATLDAATQIHTALHEPRRLVDLHDVVTCSTYDLYETAARLLEQGQIG